VAISAHTRTPGVVGGVVILPSMSCLMKHHQHHHRHRFDDHSLTLLSNLAFYFLGLHYRSDSSLGVVVTFQAVLAHGKRELGTGKVVQRNGPTDVKWMQA
jgi:hypothetical protein